MLWTQIAYLLVRNIFRHEETSATGLCGFIPKDSDPVSARDPGADSGRRPCRFGVARVAQGRGSGAGRERASAEEVVADVGQGWLVQRRKRREVGRGEKSTNSTVVSLDPSAASVTLGLNKYRGLISKSQTDRCHPSLRALFSVSATRLLFLAGSAFIFYPL